MIKAYKYLVFPNKGQVIYLNQNFGANRFVYNWGLKLNMDAYEKDKTFITAYSMAKILTTIKDKFPWLRDVDSQGLKATLSNLEKAYKKFFKEKKGFPKFKSRYDNHHSFSCTAAKSIGVDFDNNTIKIPKISAIKGHISRRFDGEIRSATVSRTATGKYYISVLVEDGKDLPIAPQPNKQKAIGLDVGIKDFCVLSDGTTISNPRFFNTTLKRLKRLQRALCRKVKGSINRDKAKKKLAMLHEKVSNQRKNFLHQNTHRITRDNETVCVEDLKISNMIKNHCLAKHIADASWGTFFQQLAYKALWRGKNVLKCGQYDASSKTCYTCKNKFNDLTLKIRKWVCSHCGSENLRDLNAALNIVDFAFA